MGHFRSNARMAFRLYVHYDHAHASLTMSIQNTIIADSFEMDPFPMDL